MSLDLPKEAAAFTCYLNLNAVDVTEHINCVFMDYPFISCISITYINSVYPGGLSID